MFVDYGEVIYKPENKNVFYQFVLCFKFRNLIAHPFLKDF